MAIASFNFGQKSNLPSTTTNGALYFLTDSGELYYGNGSSGVKISDIEIVDTYDDLEDITTPLSNKFYYVIADTVIYKYQDNDWVAISGGGGGTVNAGVGLAKAGTTIKAKLASETALDVASSSGSIVAGKIYSVNVDSSGYLCVAVPWSNTTYENKAAESGGTDVSLVTTGDKYNWNNKTSNTGTVTSVDAGDGLVTTSGSAVTASGTLKANLTSYTKSSLSSEAVSSTANRQYAVNLDSGGYLSVNVPWANTEYSNLTAAEGGTDVSLVTTGDKYNWNNKTSNTGTVTSVVPGDGLSGDTVTSSGTIKANLSGYSKSSLASAAVSSTSGRQYAVNLDSNGYLSVNVPWANTEYESKAAAQSGTDVSLVTTGEKYEWNNKTSNTGTVTGVTAGVGLAGGTVSTSGTIKANLKSETAATYDSEAVTNTENRQYAVVQDKSGYLSVNVPWVQGSSTTGTVTSVASGDGLTGGPVTTTGTLKANLTSYTKSSLASAAITSTASRQYAVNLDSSGYLSVNVPWDNTTYESKAAANGGTDVSLVTTGEKYTWNSKTSNTGTVTSVAASTGLVTASGSAVSTTGTIKANLRSETKLTNDSAAATETSGRVYPVALDKTGYLAVNVPWSDTTYESKSAASGGTAVSLVTTGEKYEWNSKTSNTGTVTSVSTGAGLTGGTITGSGTIKASLKQETNASLASNSISTTSSRQYAVTPDSSGYLSVNVPWTAYSSLSAVSGGTAVSLVTTGEKYTWNNAASPGAWTSASGSLSTGTTSYRFTNPISATPKAVEVYCENTGASVSYSGSTYSGTTPIPITGMYVTTSYIYINFPSLTVATSFKCFAWR